MKSVCSGHPDCPCTAGYYVGGGQWLCWLHALRELPLSVYQVLELQAMPRRLETLDEAFEDTRIES